MGLKGQGAPLPSTRNQNNPSYNIYATLKPLMMQSFIFVSLACHLNVRRASQEAVDSKYITKTEVIGSSSNVCI